VTRTSTDSDAVMYELNRLDEFLIQFGETPGLRDQVIKLVDYAAWEQLATAMRSLRNTTRAVSSQIKSPRLPYIEID
jgi:hypothetical protein